MEAAEEYNPNRSPVTGRIVPHWRTMCGSFVAHGYIGTANDFLTHAYTHAYIASARGGMEYPTRIVMGESAFGWYVAAFTWRILSGSTLNRNVLNFDEIVAHTVRVVTEGVIGGLNALALYDATVERSLEIAHDMIEMYIGDELVAELTGWTP
jgi:hypothetical protein